MNANQQFPSMQELYELWEELSNTPIDADTQRIQAHFLYWSEGTKIETIHSWFEAQNPKFLLKEVMAGIRHDHSKEAATYANACADPQYSQQLEALKQTTALLNQASNREIVVRVSPDYVPEEGSAFDAVMVALEHFGIPAVLVERQIPVAKDRIVIELDGGIIQNVTANAPVQYVVYDYDTEGLQEDEVAIRPAIRGDGQVETYAGGIYSAEVDAGKIAEIFDAITEE